MLWSTGARWDLSPIFYSANSESWHSLYFSSCPSARRITPEVSSPSIFRTITTFKNADQHLITYSSFTLNWDHGSWDSFLVRAFYDSSCRISSIWWCYLCLYECFGLRFASRGTHAAGGCSMKHSLDGSSARYLRLLLFPFCLFDSLVCFLCLNNLAAVFQGRIQVIYQSELWISQ